MTPQTQVDTLLGAPVTDRDGTEVGTVGEIYLDDRDGHAEWVLVEPAGTFVPLPGAEAEAGRLRLPYPAAQVSAAPRVAAEGGHLSVAEEDELYRYYGLDSSGGHLQGTTGAPATGDGAVVTRSAERLQVSTQRVTSGRVRLRKQIVTEVVHVPVEVRKEVLVVEGDGLTGGSLSGGSLASLPAGRPTGNVQTVVLHADRPVVGAEWVPVELVRIGTETVAGTTTVSEQLRTEHVEVDEGPALR